MMIEELKPYPEYKDSGLPWLGKIPAHWDLKRAKVLFEKMDRPVRPHDEIVTCFRDGVVTLRKNRRLRGYTEAFFEHGYQGIRRGDLVIHAMDAFAGAIGVSDSNGKGTPVYIVCQPTECVISNYYAILIREMSRNLWIQALSRGIRERSTDFRYDTFGPQGLAVPPLDEQAAIARFLDWANGRLERAIRAKRRAIALLNEQKQAIIHQAVTRGLDPFVPLKPSGIPWLSDVPVTWDVRKLGQCVTRIEQGWSPQCDAQPSEEGEWGVLKVGCVNKEFFNATQNKKLPSALHSAIDVKLEIQDGDILVSRANTRELLGLAALVVNPRPRLLLCDKLFRFRAMTTRVNPRFLVYSLRSKPSRAQIESSTNGASSSMQNIGQSVVKTLWLALPPLQEQERIVAALSDLTLDLNTTISRFEREIELLREYRTRLVSDVVTGKLDVREEAAWLPDESLPDMADVDVSDDAELVEEEAIA